LRGSDVANASRHDRARASLRRTSEQARPLGGGYRTPSPDSVHLGDSSEHKVNYQRIGLIVETRHHPGNQTNNLNLLGSIITPAAQYREFSITGRFRTQLDTAFHNSESPNN
jgi:hypothetical protein